MSYAPYDQRAPPHGGDYVGPLSSSMGQLSLDDTGPYHLHPGHALDGYTPRRSTADHRWMGGSPRYYESKRNSRGATADPAVEVQRRSSKKHSGSDQRTKSSTGYSKRPRSRTTSESGRPALNLLVPGSPSRQPKAVSASDKPRAPRRSYYANDDSSTYVIPASSKSRRANSGEEKRSREAKGRTKEYPKHDSKSYKKGSPVVSAGKPADMDIHNSYSYTNPREQFYRDSDHIQDYRRERARRRERPNSTSSPISYGSPVRQEPRYSGPPPSSRGFDKLPKDDSRAGYESPRDHDNHQHAKRRPVSLHQQRGDGQSRTGEYSEAVDSRGYEIRHDEDGTIIVEDRPYYKQNRAQYPQRTVDGHRDPDGAPSNAIPGGYVKPPRPGYDHGYPEGGGLDRRQSYERTRDNNRPTKHASENDSDERSSDEDNHDRRYHAAERSRRGRNDDPDDRRHSRRTEHAEDGSPPAPRPDRNRPQPDAKEEEDSERSDSGGREENRQRKVQLVDPEQTKEIEAAPKGILKRPTQKFPEDPNAVREGVAPLRDAHKKGIPPAARWTKIDRRLVSPSALEGQERFEERPDYVIVLRVLSKEDIHHYAMKTAEIRASRYNSDRRDRERDDERDGRSYSDDEDDEDKKEPLAIEAPPDSRHDTTRNR